MTITLEAVTAVTQFTTLSTLPTREERSITSNIIRFSRLSRAGVFYTKTALQSEVRFLIVVLQLYKLNSVSESINNKI